MFFAKGSPCNNYKILDSPNDFTRSVANGGGQNCDNTLAGGWVRFISKSGERMPTQCVYGGFRCGTQIPIWMNGMKTYCYKNIRKTSCLFKCRKTQHWFGLGKLNLLARKTLKFYFFPD